MDKAFQAKTKSSWSEILDIALAVVFLGPTSAFYVMSLILFLFVMLFSNKAGGPNASFIFWYFGAGVGLITCFRLLSWHRRERLKTLSPTIWTGLLIGFIAFGVVVVRAGVPGNIQEAKFVFMLGGGPAAYVLIVLAGMAVRDRRIAHGAVG
ncbi:hypothetical protein LRS11_10790 [Pseudomonas sp. J452]|uniref:hypothetical protein n=1 Tax=Pseudomonas sp. J452 TaxID=2898441 RepID=UPI0021AD5689|nr:hypothetical protein [Pseudomonas sp. J452]UUY10475.1 hypothetical protein LRS11_10790 [Pseudomonas sp. J452]